MITRWNTRLIKAAVGVFCICVGVAVLFNKQDGYQSTRGLIHAGRTRLENTVFDHIGNETLGFEHVYAIGLKERTDKHDFLTLAASISGINVDWLDGVRPGEVSQKALPDRLDGPNVPYTAVLCWRAHMNALRSVVENRYATALIMEDDADWDVSVRLQLREFARGVRKLTNNEKAPRKTPYGTNWDLLWVGGCATTQERNTTELYVIPDDPTTISVDRRGPWDDKIGPTDSWKSKHPEYSIDSTRFVYRAGSGCCMYGYAVTYEGARKILAALSLDWSVEVDTSLSDLCGGWSGREQIRCYGVYPNIISTFKPAGPASRSSDIQNYTSSEYREAESWNIMYSTRMNLNRLLAGEETVYSQWNTSFIPWSKPEIRLRDLEYPRGYLV
ncbi:hypothetical protein P175DRAFT_0500703 [Aspergillus ochraceoroseus IBT 24754]|uniref:LPS glycosyltransferase n=2 Tax=Aspergillus ochraceoroseus TaxID=138278 RepID=A0A2T5LZV4_9EURO|nr:uncharacterized protein P175DRAFT_0500703 [Aspergillus ochraceoroseus IBT 24754]KKK18201.1 hypothetical protein AOCH_005627 [Aspergillus ochraceoroseus]PTU21817.1 hypothetical protein P175DRAFT_0500703 [Aspergillus ochraceoroseus IBT 24754]